MATLAGGTVAAGRLQAGPGVPEREAIRLDWARSSQRLGAPGDPEFAAGHLRSVGCRTEVTDRRTVRAVPKLALRPGALGRPGGGGGPALGLRPAPGHPAPGHRRRLTDAQRLRRQAGRSWPAWA